MGYLLLISLVAVVATVAEAVDVPVRLADVGMFGILAAMGIVQAELGRQVERVRRRISGAIHINMTSVWFLPAVLLLPPVLVAALVTLLSTHLHLRSWYRMKQVPALRTAISVFAIILTCYATRAAVAAITGDGIRGASLAGWTLTTAVVVGIGTYFVVNIVVVIPARPDPDRAVRDAIGNWLDNVLELATLCLGAFTALALATLPAIAVLMVLPVFILHRGVLVNQLESATRQDDKTGVWNSAGWHRLAYLEQTRAERDGAAFFGVLMVDIDHFKKVNDGYGHLAGDVVLKAVADTIRRTIRDRDSVGRFGGEEFVVLLPDTPEADVHVVAERVRTAIAWLRIAVDVADQEQTIHGLSVSIGVASYPAAGTAIDELLQAADVAMYRAKRNGRNQVVSFVESGD